MKITNFSAQEPSLGYYYQIRYSLYLLLSKRDKTNPCIKLENLDDIVIEDISSTDLYLPVFIIYSSLTFDCPIL